MQSIPKSIWKCKNCTFNHVFACCDKGSEFPFYSLQTNVTPCTHKVKVSAGIIFFAWYSCIESETMSYRKKKKKLLVNFMFVYFSFASTVIYSSFHPKMWAVCITRKFGYSYNLLFINKLFPVLILYFS